MARWALISFDKGTDRPGTLTSLASRLRSEGVSLVGYFQQRVEQESKQDELVRLSNGERVAAGREREEGSPDGGCPYHLEEDAFATARRWLDEDCREGQVILIDDVSKYEVKGRGNAEALAWALGLDAAKVVLISARASYLFYLVDRFGLREEDCVGSLELPAEEALFEAFCAKLVAGTRSGDS